MRHLAPRLASSVGAIAWAIFFAPAAAVAEGDQAPQASPVTVAGISRQPTDDWGPDRGPIEHLSLSLAVNYSDLDLRTPAGVNELEARIQAAAEAACAKIDAYYPQQLYVPTPGDQQCVRSAVRAAMPQVGRLVASRGGGTWIAAVSDPTR